jgi:hypothetical protein
MAKKAKSSSGESNKSQAIRDYMSANPDAGPTSVADALNASQGWKISAAYVSTIKNKVKGGKKLRRGVRRAARTSGGGGGGAGVNEQALLQAKKLAEQIGSIDKAKAALDLLGKLTT